MCQTIITKELDTYLKKQLDFELMYNTSIEEECLKRFFFVKGGSSSDYTTVCLHDNSLIIRIERKFLEKSGYWGISAPESYINYPKYVLSSPKTFESFLSEVYTEHRIAFKGTETEIREKYHVPYTRFEKFVRKISRLFKTNVQTQS